MNELIMHILCLVGIIPSISAIILVTGEGTRVATEAIIWCSNERLSSALLSENAVFL